MRIKSIIPGMALLFCSLSLLSFGQEKDGLIQFSGVVITADSLKPVSFTHIINKSLRRGTTADYYGYFSFVARRGDVIQFSSMGFKKAIFVIPDSIIDTRYSVIQVMTTDTLLLSETIIYPWPTYEQFKEAFVNMKIPDDDYDRAMKNLEQAEIVERAMLLPMDGSMNYRNYIQDEVRQLYYYGQQQPITILDPFAWARFIKAWKEGKFKRKDK